jgi:hypothetical protein
MNGYVDISNTVNSLEKEIISYLKDAGFQDSMYEIETYDDREYVRVYMSECGIDYILKDVEKSNWRQILEIKK